MALDYFTLTDTNSKEIHYRRRRWEERNNPNVPVYTWYIWKSIVYDKPNNSYYNERDWKNVDMNLSKKLEEMYQNVIRGKKLERILK